MSVCAAAITQLEPHAQSAGGSGSGGGCGPGGSALSGHLGYPHSELVGKSDSHGGRR